MSAAPLASPALPTRCQWCHSTMTVMFKPYGLTPVGALCDLCDAPSAPTRRRHFLLRGNPS